MNRWRSKKHSASRRAWIWKLLLAAALCCGLLLIAEARLAPLIEAQAMQRVHNAALSEMALAVSRQVAEHSEAGNYHSLMHIERDQQGKIVMISADMPLINSLIAALTEEIDQALSSLGEQRLTIPLFALTGSKLFSSWGPQIPIDISGIATPSVELTDSFVAAGINQTKHSIYLEIEAKLQVAVPFQQETCTVATKVLLAEGILIGEVPEAYLQLERGTEQ